MEKPREESEVQDDDENENELKKHILSGNLILA